MDPVVWDKSPLQPYPLVSITVFLFNCLPVFLSILLHFKLNVKNSRGSIPPDLVLPASAVAYVCNSYP